MADSVGVIGEAFVAAALSEAATRLFSPDSRFWRWLDQVSQPPDGLVVDGHDRYSGVLFVVDNQVRRALVLEHRTSAREREARTRWDVPHRRPDSYGWDDGYPDDDGRLPGF